MHISGAMLLLSVWFGAGSVHLSCRAGLAPDPLTPHRAFIEDVTVGLREADAVQEMKIDWRLP